MSEDFLYIGPLVQQFSQEMQRKLNANSHKGGWDEMPYRAMIRRLKQEVAELEEEIRNGCNPERVILESADVGNFAAFIAWKAGEALKHV